MKDAPRWPGLMLDSDDPADCRACRVLVVCYTCRTRDRIRAAVAAAAISAAAIPAASIASDE